MGETTGIGWTDATVNFWWGCTKIGPACDFCYAEQWDKKTGGAHWGVGVPRRKIKSAPALMDKLTRTRPGARVFVSSMCDIFDNEVPLVWFHEAWLCVQWADALRIQVVTKRLTIIEKRLDAIKAKWPQHAGLIITVINQAEIDRDVPRAIEIKKRLGIPWLGLSIEPQLGPVDLGCVTDHPEFAFPGLDWVICGGESKQGKGHSPRPFDLAWARLLRDQCSAAGIDFFMKQLGSNPISDHAEGYIEPVQCGDWFHLVTRDRAGAEPSEWPEDLRVQEFPEALRQ